MRGVHLTQIRPYNGGRGAEIEQLDWPVYGVKPWPLYGSMNNMLSQFFIVLSTVSQGFKTRNPQLNLRAQQ